MINVQNYFKDFKVGTSKAYQNLTLYPLFREEGPRLQYLMLDEALKMGVLTITEVSEAGQVSDLKVQNDGDTAVLLLDGEELSGAKQDRILNTTVLVAPHATIIIPVSCVEHGRWQYKGKKFYSHERIFKPTERGMKAKRLNNALRTGAGFRAGQSEIWDDVSRLHKKFKIMSETGAYGDFYEDQKVNLESFIRNLSIDEGQTGFVALINNRITGIENLSRPDAFKKAWPKLIRSYALDAIDMRMGETEGGSPKKDAGNGHHEKITGEAISEWLSSINPQDLSIHNSPGLGKDIRWDEGGTVGFMLEHDSEVIHAAVFAEV